MVQPWSLVRPPARLYIEVAMDEDLRCWKPPEVLKGRPALFDREPCLEAKPEIKWHVVRLPDGRWFAATEAATEQEAEQLAIRLYGMTRTQPGGKKQGG